jgi:hypothetical protein
MRKLLTALATAVILMAGSAIVWKADAATLTDVTMSGLPRTSTWRPSAMCGSELQQKGVDRSRRPPVLTGTDPVHQQ